jgi:hypothetical protein
MCTGVYWLALCTRKIDLRDGLDRLRGLVGCGEQRHVPAERALVT